MFAKNYMDKYIECILSNRQMQLQKGKTYLVESLSWGIGVKTKSVSGEIEIDLDEWKNRRYFKF